MYSANYFSNALLVDNGNLNFDAINLPWEAQLSTFRDAVVVDANADGKPDILIMGNYYENNIEMGRYDADYGTLLINKGNNKLEAQSLNGLNIKGQVRQIKPIVINKKQAYIIAKNNDSSMVIQFSSSK